MNLDLEDVVNIQMQPLFPCVASAKAAFLSCAFASLSIKWAMLCCLSKEISEIARKSSGFDLKIVVLCSHMTLETLLCHSSHQPKL